MTAAKVHHQWHECMDGETRYCCTPFANGGCGAMQVREPRITPRVRWNGLYHWFPPVCRSCTDQRKVIKVNEAVSDR